jgi:phosphatidylglycerophosphate synthase
MVAVAVIVIAGGESVSPLVTLGGVSLLKRAVLTAQKAGVTTCYLCLGYDAHVTDDLRHEIHGDARVTSQVVWVRKNFGTPSVRAQTPADQCVVFSVTAIFRHPLIKALAHETAAEKIGVFTDISGTFRLAVVPALQIAPLLQELTQGKPLAETSVIQGGERKQIPSSLFCQPLTSASHVTEVERALLLSLENPRDGRVDTYFNRKLSRPLTRCLVQTPLTPNQITILSCLVGLVGALCFFPGGYWGPVVGALLLQFSVVLDCCDGEVARIKFLESAFGDVLDIVCDTVVTVAIFIGVGVAVWNDGASSHALSLAGLLALGGCLAFPLVTLAEKTETVGDRRGGWEDQLMKRLVASLTTRDVSVVIFASALTGKLPWFLWGAAIGAQAFWLLLFWLLWRAGRFHHWLRGAEVKE